MNFYPERTDSRGLQKNQRALEALLDQLFDAVGALILEHGDLVGLGDDDHAQYHNDARGDARYLKLDASNDPVTGALVVRAAAFPQLEVVGPTGTQAQLRFSQENGPQSWAFRITPTSTSFRIVDVTASGVDRLAIDTSGRITLGPGNPRFVGRTSTAADPTTTELPADKDFGLHKNTTSGSVFLAYNDGGVIKKVALT